MNYTDKAKEMALKAHEGLFYDVSTETPYSYHLNLVVMYAESLCKRLNLDVGNTDIVLASAWLHDTVEDGLINPDVITEWCGYGVSETVRRLTHDKDTSYNSYIDYIKHHKLATIVKKADVMANLACSVLEGDKKRVNKYANALKRLCS